MEPQEVNENVEHAHHSGQKAIGLTTSIVAALLAIATLLGERSHTEEVLLRGEANDQWAYYQAKKIRAHIYEADAQLAKLSGEAGNEVATELVKKSTKYDADAEEIQKEARKIEEQQKAVARRADYFNAAQLFLWISIVLCSMALLTETKVYWKVSFITTLVGVALVILGFLLHQA